MSEPLIRRVNREQMLWRGVDVERLIEEDHSARAIWDLVGRLDWNGFYEGIECSAEEGGRPAFDPRLLISLWIYAYSQGIGSAREVARRCEWEPALQWLTGCEAVNYHTLASFRVEHRGELDELFTQVLGLLSAEGLISLEQVVQDGTKIKAQAASDSFQGEARIGEHLERARRSFTIPNTTTMFVRETSTCATKDGRNTSRETFSIATKPGPRTVRAVP